MTPLIHFIFSLILAAGLFKDFSFDVVWIFVGGVLIDIDHYFWYLYQGSKGNIIDAYKHFSSSKRLKEHHENLKNELYIFHNFEFLAILIVASIYSNIALLILIGAFFHYLLDWINEIWNIKKVKTLSFIAFVMKTKKRKKE